MMRSWSSIKVLSTESGVATRTDPTTPPPSLSLSLSLALSLALSRALYVHVTLEVRGLYAQLTSYGEHKPADVLVPASATGTYKAPST